MKRQIAIFIFVNILLQSCVVYQKTSVPIESVVDKGKGKLITTNGEKFIFKRIVKDDSTYYAKVKSDKIPISAESVKFIYLVNYPLSNLLTLLFFGVPIVVFLYSLFFNPFG